MNVADWRASTMNVADCYTTYKLLKLVREDVNKEGSSMVRDGDHRGLAGNLLTLRKLDDKLRQHRDRCMALLLGE